MHSSRSTRSTSAETKWSKPSEVQPEPSSSSSQQPSESQQPHKIQNKVKISTLKSWNMSWLGWISEDENFVDSVFCTICRKVQRLNEVQSCFTKGVDAFIKRNVQCGKKDTVMTHKN